MTSQLVAVLVEKDSRWQVVRTVVRFHAALLLAQDADEASSIKWIPIFVKVSCPYGPLLKPTNIRAMLVHLRPP